MPHVIYATSVRNIKLTPIGHILALRKKHQPQVSRIYVCIYSNYTARAPDPYPAGNERENNRIIFPSHDYHA